KILCGGDNLLALERALPDQHRVLQLRVAADRFEAVTVALAIAELEGIMGHIAHRHDLVLGVVEDVRQPLRRIHAHVVVGAWDDELVGLQVLVEHHLPRIGAFHPQIVGDFPFGGEQPTDLGTDAVDPIHASRAPSGAVFGSLSTPHPHSCRYGACRYGRYVTCRYGADLKRGATPATGFSPD